MILFFIVLQSVLLFFMLFHDWIPVPPLNDTHALKKYDRPFYRFFGSAINGALVFIPLLLTLLYTNVQNVALGAPIFYDNSFNLLRSVVNDALVSIPLLLKLLYTYGQGIVFGANISIALFYGLLSVGTILSWWVPYFFGSSEKLKNAFSKFKNTHHFLPPRKDHIIPNTLHVILHLQVWTCFALSLYFLLSHP